MPKETDNIIGYVKTEFATLEGKPFTEVDSLVLSKLAYFHWDCMDEVPKTLERRNAPRLCELYKAEYFDALFDMKLDNDLDHVLFAVVAASPRFRDIRITNHKDSFDEETDKQFSATTFLLPDKTVYVAYRGTDETLTGWKEDFNLAFITPVPSQQAGAEYFDRLAEGITGKLRLGGHSKGGNLAVYAAAKCKPGVRERILQVYSHDGPGFNEQALASMEYRRIAERVNKSVPEQSVIGMLLEHHEHFHVVKSDGIGIMQHDAYSWLVKDGTFVIADKLGASADYVNATLSTWIGGMSTQQMEVFTDALFRVFGAGGNKTFQEMTLADYVASAEALIGMDPDMRKMFLETLTELASLGVRGLIPKRDEQRELTRQPSNAETAY